MENEVDLAPAGPDLSGTPNLGPGTSPLYPGQGAGLFGSNRTMVPTTIAPNPLDDAEARLTAARNRAQIGAQSPFIQFVAPKIAGQLNEEATKADLQIQQIQEKKQQQQTNQALARNMGLTRGMSPTAGPGDITEEALREWRENGNYDAYRGLHGAGQGARADLYMDEGVGALGKKTEAAQKAVEQLNSATNQSEYNSIRANVLKHPDFSSLGMNENNLPKYRTEWEQKRGGITAKLNSASQVVEQFKQKQASLSQAVPISDEKVAKAVTAPLRMSSGESFPNTDAVSLPGAGGAQGALAQPGSKDIEHYGPDGWNNATPENVKTVREQFASEEVKGAISKYKMSKDFAATANNNTMYRSAAGLALIADELGAIGRDVAEGSKAAGSIGLTRMLNEKYGSVENFLNSTTNNYAAWKAWVTSGRKGEEPKLLPRMTEQSIQGIKDVANFKAAQTKAELERAGGPVETAGRYGIALEKTGLDKGAQDVVRGVWDEALQKAKLDYDRYPAIIKGDRRVILPQDAQVPGMIPAGSYAKGLPKAGQGGSGEIAPSQGLHSAAPTVQGMVPANATLTNGLPSGPNGGGGAPASGISPDYLIKTAKVESGNEPDPWGAGNSKTSASGAYQFTNATWNQYKPPGAPNRAAEATPQQQTEAANNLTNANAKVLARNDIPVNDTTAYIAHNLGAAGAVNFMKARDDAKARAVVGETAANNNPLFFKGDPTVAEAKARYAKVMNQPTAEQIAAYNANREGFAATRAKMAASATHNAANIAPALGAVAGMPMGPAGVLAGGAAGGAIRQGFNGGPGYVDQMARGALEAVPAAIPGVRPLATAVRMVAGGAVPAAEKLYDSGGADTAGAIESGAAGALGSVAGEAFGRALGMAGHKIYSRFSDGAQTEVRDAAKVLATQQPKVADATGKMVPNTVYEKAEQTVKDAGIDAEHAAYAYNVSKAGIPKGEAITQRPGAVEAAKVGKEYGAIQNDIADAASTMSKNITPRNVQNGPTSLIRDASNPSGTVPAKYARDAEDAQLRVTAPAKTWDAKWNQLGDARSDLLKKERDALASTANGKTERAEAMRALADAVRVQQEKVALHVLGPVRGKTAIARLEAADVRYRNAMVASGDGDIVKAIAQGGAEGRKAQAAFDALAANDPAAQRIVRSLVEMEKGLGKRLGVAGATLLSASTLHFVPVVGNAAAATITIAKAQQMLRDYMAKKGAGAPVKFGDMIARESRKGYVARAGSVIGSSAGAQMAQ